MPPLPFVPRHRLAHRFFTATDAHRRGIARMVPPSGRTASSRGASTSVSRLPVACISWASS